MRIRYARIIFLLSLCLIPFSFNCQTTDHKPKLSNSLVVYVEARDGINTGCCGYGDIIVYDLESNTEHKITDDEFYDAEPKFSPDGKFILFRSNRSGSTLSRDIRGVSGPWPYIYGLETGNIEELRFANFNPLFMSGVRSLIWGPDSETLLFIFRNKIMQYSIANDSMIIYQEFNDSLKLYDLTYIQDFLSWRYEEDYQNTTLILSDFTKKDILDNIDIEHAGIIGSINKDNLILSGFLNDTLSIFKYNVISKRVSVIVHDICSNIGFVYPDDLFYSDNLLYFLQRKEDSIIDELGRYEFSLESITWINQNKKTKKDLDIYNAAIFNPLKK